MQDVIIKARTRDRNDVCSERMKPCRNDGTSRRCPILSEPKWPVDRPPVR